MRMSDGVFTLDLGIYSRAVGKKAGLEMPEQIGYAKAFPKMTGKEMSGTRLSTADLDPRRKQILFRAWHRGTKEMDLVMGGFADEELPTLSAAELDQFEALIPLADRDLFSWISGAAIPSEYDTELFRRMKAFHHRPAAERV
jgi:antitoxin CptB